MSEASETSTDLTVVVPVLSEEVEFEKILESYGREFDRRGISYEFVFVLDGTSDRFFEELGQRRPAGRSVRLIKFNQQFGESIALSAGFKIARGRVVLSLPSFVQTEPADVQHVLDAIEERGADVVTCWRTPRVDPWLNRVQSALFNLVMRMLTGVRVHDLNCLQRAMRRRVFEEVNIQGDMYRFLPVLAHRAGYQVSEVAVRHLKEGARTGVFGLGVYLRRMLDISALLFLTRFTRKPLRFFGLAGGMVFLLGFATCLWLSLEFFLRESAPETRALLILGVLLMVLGVQTFFIGLVAEIIIFTQGRNLKDYRVGRIEEGHGPGTSSADASLAERERTAAGGPAPTPAPGREPEVTGADPRAAEGSEADEAAATRAVGSAPVTASGAVRGREPSGGRREEA